MEPNLLVYVGTYSVRGSKGVYVYRLDTVTGAMTLVGTAAGAPVASPSFLALHPRGRFLYAASEAGSGAVAAFALDPATGIPTLLNQQPSQGGGPCYVSLDKDGRYVFVANYGAGSVAALPVAPDGRLLPATAAIQHHGGSGANPKRQQGPHAHCIQTDPSSGRFVLAADLGLDQILVYRFDPAKGTLTPNDPPYGKTHPGAGPRHLAFRPDGRLVFVANELDSTVTAFAWDARKGTLTEKQTVSTLPDGFTGTNHPAEIAVHPTGRFVYASNRGHDSLAAFAVDPAAASPLRPLGHTPTGGKNPRNFAIVPGGELLIAAHQDTDSLVVFRVDTKTGRLTPAGVTVDVPSPVCVCFGSAA